MRDIHLDEKVELLKKADIFSSLKDDELEIISNYSNIYRFEKGEMIFQDDITANELFIIRKGDVLIYRNQMDGKRLILAHYIEEKRLANWIYLQIWSGILRLKPRMRLRY